jgi:hypothetical protein
MRILRTILVLLAALSAGADELTLSQLKINAEIPWSDQGGYTPLVIQIESSEASGRLRIEAEMAGETAVADIFVTPGAHTHTILLPSSDSGAGWYTPQCKIRITTEDGESTDQSTSSQGMEFDVIVLDPKEELPLSRIAGGFTIQARTRHGSTQKYEASRFRRFPPQTLPDRWQGYPLWAAIMLSESGEADLSSEQRQAIAKWLRAGGRMFVASPRLFETWKQPNGSVSFFDSADGALVRSLEECVTTLMAEAPQPQRTPIPGTEKVPVTGFLILAILFAIVVGPLNLWWVRRANARHLFLLTTPALSLATCICLLGFNLAMEGVSLRRVAQQLVYLDNGTQECMTWSKNTYFSGFSVTAMELSQDTKLLPYDPEDAADRYRYSYRYDSNDRPDLGLDWRHNQAAMGAWIPGRVNRQLVFADASSKQQRLLIAKSGEGWEITNGLGVAVTSLTWRDGEGREWHCEETADGARAQLAPGPRASAELSQLMNKMADAKNGESTASAIEQLLEPAVQRLYLRTCLSPYSFHAELEKPFVELPGPESEDMLQATGKIFGFLRPFDGAQGRSTP